MKLAFDLDGCLADFTTAYAARLVKITGENLLPKPLALPCWDWDKFYGYTKQQIDDTIRSVAADKLFWEKLKPLAEPEVFARINVLSKTHEVYFLTNRFGVNAKQQTEKFLYDHGIYYPTVIVTSNKKPILDTLKVDFFVDDKLETMNELASPPRPHFYLIDAPYNQTGRVEGLKTASNVKDALVKAELW
jgi:uncharacterized HAD superfamily protein